jgi:peptidoglycan/xylan/chitin deacetylase (PgdA/CDA1 family)
MVLLVLVGFALVALAHTAPAPFILDAMAGDTAVWHMPRGLPHTVYLTFDDGPNPTTTPDLLDVLAHEGVPATFFLIDEHITDETAPIVRRILADGHAVGLHSRSRGDVLLSAEELEHKLTAAALRIQRLAGAPPCRAFRPHAGWRGGEMYAGRLRRRHHRDA